MKLIIGGYAQGKSDYVRMRYHLQEDAVWEDGIPDGAGIRYRHGRYRGKTVVVDHFHQWVRKCMADGRDPGEETTAFLAECRDQGADCIIISDEVGNGIVPVDAFERAYRESLGRILIQLAERAEEVERVLCGIGQKIK